MHRDVIRFDPTSPPNIPWDKSPHYGPAAIRATPGEAMSDHNPDQIKTDAQAGGVTREEFTEFVNVSADTMKATGEMIERLHQRIQALEDRPQADQTFHR